MRLIKPSFEIWDQQEGLEGIYKQIERAGRVCYKSEPKYRWYSEDKKRWINEDSEEWKAIENPKKEYPTRGENISAKPFVDRMVKSGHGAMLEHGTVYLKLNNSMSANVFLISQKYDRNKYSVVNYRDYENDVNNRGVTYQEYFITTNYRVLVEKGWLDDLQYLCEPTEYHEGRLTIHFTTQIAISREFNRHRVDSMAEQSTRYCDYSGNNEKFEGVGINLPSWVDSEIQRLEDITENVLPTFEQLKEEYFSVSDQGITKDDWGDIEWWLWSSLIAEESYQNLRKLGRKPQEARVVLPLDTNTELVHTASISDWKHFFQLRCDKTAHPDARILAEPLQEEFYNKNILK